MTDVRSVSTGIVAAAACALVAGACGADGAGGAGWGGRIDTLAGGGVRVVSPADGRWSEEEAWRLVETLRIGSTGTPGPALFGEIADVTVDDEGRIHVLEQQAHELRVFAPDGTHVRTIGREGEGPGELNIPFGGSVILGPEGRIWINNSMNRRWELFGVDGEFVTSIPRETTLFGGDPVLGRDGSLYLRERATAPGGESRSVLVRWEVDGAALLATDTLEYPEIPEPETVSRTLSTSSGNTMTMAFPIPFVHQPGFSFDPAVHFWVEPGDGYRLIALGPEHDTLRIVERDYEPVPVTDAERTEAIESLAASDVDVDRSRVPDFHPAFDRYRTDETNHLWVRRSLGGDRLAWDVFDPEGVYLGPVRSEVDLSRLTVHQVTADAVYGVLRDDLDIPYVVRLDIRNR